MPTECQRVSAGSEIRRTGPGISPLWHYHQEIELNLVTAGKGVYFLDSAHYDLSPGRLVWMLPNQSHRLLPGPDLQMWVLTCSTERLERSLLDDAARHASRILARDDAIALDRVFAHVSQESDEPQLYRVGLEYALRSALHISMSGPEAAQAPLHPAVLTALRVLRNAPDIPNAAALAQRCGVSAVYLRELLAEQTRRGFVEWRSRFRLERFQLIYPRCGDLLTAALEAGFGSYTQFHRVFLSIVGTTPGEWITGGRETAGTPPVADFLSAPVRASRLTWYVLADLVLEDARRWITPSFSERLADAGAPLGKYCPVPSHVVASYDQHRFTADLISEIERRNSAIASRLALTFDRFDVFKSYSESLSLWGIDLTDLAPLIGCHLVIACVAMFGTAPPNLSAVVGLVSRVAMALNDSGSFAQASIEDRQRATAAICTQSFILRSAVVAAQNSGKPELSEAVSATARKSVLETYGVKLGHQFCAGCGLAPSRV
ncbi:AraC family transcriptional regulator [Sphingomonas bacterium]|uniref:AraC family transcriptional regulator n=1 Tax=Sphingomonas bacterium TaxID=1895847 RepID=UPI001575496A|nr:AraC family transcriptional regulator [Sphingomonas bacterium]